ncbi:MAG: DUF58 domain-containing protein [Burkholderiaceae bacterium]
MTAPAASLSPPAPPGPAPLGRIRQRFQKWFNARLKLTDTLTLTQRNVYILPTQPGLMMAATLLVLLVASINYQLNLGYLLTFLLAGSVVIGMHVTHGTLRGLTMHLIAPPAQYAGASAVFDIKLSNPGRTVRYGIGLTVLNAHHWSWTDVPAQGTATVQVAFKPLHRGLQHLPTLSAETRFPLGTFRVWTIWRPAAQVLVYPAPEAHPPPLPPGEPHGSGAASARMQSSGEFDGVRAYRRGDPTKLVVWKKVAQAQARGSSDLVSRDNQQSQRHELWLDLALAGSHLGLEGQLSRLCAWVLLAEKQGLDYGLRLPGHSLAPANGEAHKQNCLSALALHR